MISVSPQGQNALFYRFYNLKHDKDQVCINPNILCSIAKFVLLITTFWPQAFPNG